MAEASDARELVEAQAAERDADFFPLNDLPNDVLVSVFMAVVEQAWRRHEALLWVRYTVPLVCKAWNELYLSKDASPLHETLEVNFEVEVEEALAQSDWLEEASFDEDYDEEVDEEDEESQSDEEYDEEEEERRRYPIVHASRVIAWAQRRAGSVRKLDLRGLEYKMIGSYLKAIKSFGATNMGRLVAVVGPSLTDISVGLGLARLCKSSFWEALRTSVVPAGRLRSLVIEGFMSVVDESDVEPLGQLAGSLEELALSGGLQRFPESFCALKKLRRLALSSHPEITAIPAGISSLKELKELELVCCELSSLPKELGELSGLEKLYLRGNGNLGTTLPAAEAFPAELGKMKSLRVLSLQSCGLRTVPAFVGGLESLESLDLFGNGNLQIDAPLDFLFEGCPRLQMVRLTKYWGSWTPESLAHREAFKAKLLARNPNADFW